MKAINVAAVAAAVLCFLAVTGCTLPDPSGPAAPSGGALPPPEDLEAAPGEAGAVAPAEGEAGTAASGVVIESISPDPSAAAAPSAITLPAGSGWTRPDIPLTQQQADIEACFNAATAQIARETQIDEDRYDARIYDDQEDYYGLTTLTRRVDYYSEKRRRGALFDSCMEAKGYIKG